MIATSTHVRILAGHLDNRAGSSVYHRELALRLAERGFRVSVVCFESVPEVSRCCDVLEIPIPEYCDTPLLWRFASLRRHWDCLRQLRLLDTSRPQIIIGGEHLLLQGHHRRNLDVPWIYLPHSLLVSGEIGSYGLSPLMQWSTMRVYRQIQRWALQTANRTMRFTNIGLRVLADAYTWKPDERGTVNPVGIDLPLIDNNRASPTFRMLVVGRLVKSKNVQLALKALAGLQSAEWSLDIVGTGSESSKLQALAHELGCSGRVCFRGHQDDCSPWYQRADLLLFPSKLESLGLVLLEAMAHGVPCLAMRPDGVNYRNANEELINDDETGLLAADEDEFTSRLQWASSHRSELCRMGAAARKYVEQHQAWDSHLDRYEALFEELCGPRPPGTPVASLNPGQDVTQDCFAMT